LAGAAGLGCEPELAADAKQSFDTGVLTEWAAAETTRTLADGLRTQSLGERNFAHIRRFTDGSSRSAKTKFAPHSSPAHLHNLVAEPSGAVTLAAALFHFHEMPKARKLAAVVSGGNLEPGLRAELESEAEAVRLSRKSSV